jgi:hypothetical protein
LSDPEADNEPMELSFSDSSAMLASIFEWAVATNSHQTGPDLVMMNAQTDTSPLCRGSARTDLQQGVGDDWLGFLRRLETKSA